jgi:hypothetical protein
MYRLTMMQNCPNHLKAFLREYDRIVMMPFPYHTAKVENANKKKC